MDVAVTGIGAITPLGASVEATWTNLLAGCSGVREVTDQLDGMELPTRAAAAMAVDPASLLDRVAARRLDRVQQALLVAAAEAWACAGTPDVEPERLAVVAGTGIGGLHTILEQQRILYESGPRKVSPRTVPMLMANAGAAQLSIIYHAKAGCYTPVSACSSGAEAFASGARLIEQGHADVVIVGGADAAITPLTISAFAAAGALCTDQGLPPAERSRPFDARRNGFVLGEGAGVAVLERASHATARGATILAILAGTGITSDAHHITSPDPSGEQQQRAMRDAIHSADLTPADIGHVNCHATGTTVGDIIETDAIRAAIGQHPLLTAPKSSLGHLVGAAGAIEAILTVQAVRHHLAPPTINLTRPDPHITQPITTAPTPITGAALTNSFAFGGQNTALLFTPH